MTKCLAHALLAGMLATLVALPAVHAAKVYKWVDARGVAHYGDHVPQSALPPRNAAQVQVVPVAAEPSAIATLSTRAAGGGFQAVADNRIAGPVEVRVEFVRGSNVRAEPLLPARAVVGARGRAVIASISPVDGSRPGDFELRMEVVPGDPRARADGTEYLLPLQMRSWRIDQGFGGSFSHDDEQNRFALDLAAPVGTPVLAARGGVVMQVESDFARAGMDRERYAGRANLVRILHADGTMGMYAHLKSDGVLVSPGQRVRAGQAIALSGNTGYTTGPHLHFAVQVNRGMRLESIRFRMRGPQGPMRLGGG